MSDMLPFEDLERVYDLIAEAIDEVGEEKESLFLAKLVMILAHHTRDLDIIEKAISSAMENLDNDSQGP